MGERHRVYLHKPREYRYLHTWSIWYSLLLLGSKTVRHIKKKVKQSHYKPGVAQRVPGS